MKIKHILIPALLFCNVIQAQISTERLKGTWAIAALCSKDTNISVLFSRDTVVRSLISNKNPDAEFMYRSNSGKYHDYWFFYLQYFSFDKREVGSGYAKDSTFTIREKGFQGKYSLRKGILYCPFFVIRDWQKVNILEFPVEYELSFEGDYLVMTSKGGKSFYYRKVSEEVMFRD